MRLVISIGIRHAGEQILIVFAGQQIAIGQGFLAEFGEIGIARVVGGDGEAPVVDLLAIGRVGLGGFGHGAAHRIGKHLASLGGDQRV